MLAVSQAIDALWHSLCPSFPSIRPALASPAFTLGWKNLKRRPPTARRPIQRISIQSYLTQRENFITPQTAIPKDWRHHLIDAEKTPGRGDLGGNGTNKATASLSQLYEDLRQESYNGEFTGVQELVRTLVIERGEKPNVRLYIALIVANISPRYGSPERVERLLQEMVDEGIQHDSNVFHAVLKVLAIHPDYLLREEILEELRQRWLSLTNEGWHDVVAGLVRDRQVERAMDKLEEMQRTGREIQSWLYDIFDYNFCSSGDFDEVLRIMSFRDHTYPSSTISNTLLYHILDMASQCLHYAATRYAWRKRIERGYINPSSGICINVLNTAARHGDHGLATDVFRILGNRTNTLELHHYEALFESYLAASKLESALSVLPLMVSSDCPPTEATMRPLYLHLRTSPDLPSHAFGLLKAMRKDGTPISTVAFNAVIEAAIYAASLDVALDLYKNLHKLCPNGPTTATFNTLFRGCSQAGRKDLAMFLAAEMLALKVQPDALTYDRLILTCVDGRRSEDFEDAWRYLEEMKGRGWWMRRGTCVAVVRRCCEWGDERVWKLVEEMEGRGMEVTGVLRWVGLNWRGSSGGRKVEGP